MADYFTLTRKSNLDAGHVPINTIDAEMCQFFKVPVDPTAFYRNWYGTIGTDLAKGLTIRQIIVDHYSAVTEDNDDAFDAWTKKIEIMIWLDANFIANIRRKPRCV